MKSFNSLHPVFAVAAAAAVFLSGCGASSGTSVAMDTVSSSAAAEATAPRYENGGIRMVDAAAPQEDSLSLDSTAEAPKSSVPTERKIIKRCELSLETKEFDDALSKLVQLVESSGGYVEAQSTDGRSLNNRDTYYDRSAQIHARIPADKLDEVTSSVGTLCNIVSRNDSTDDITDTYFDSQAHLDVLKIQEERLLDILQKATKLEDVVTLEKALSDVRYQIESLTASLKRMDSQVTYSYLNLYLQEVGEYNQPISTPKSFGERLSITFSRSISHMTDSIQGAILFLVEVAPTLLLWVAIVALIFLASLKTLAGVRVRRLRKQENVSPAEDSDQPKT